MDSFFLSYLPPQHRLCQAENPPTLEQASQGFGSHTCVEASSLLFFFSSPFEPHSSRAGPGGILVLHVKATSSLLTNTEDLIQEKDRVLLPRRVAFTGLLGNE